MNTSGVKCDMKILYILISIHAIIDKNKGHKETRNTSPNPTTTRRDHFY